MSEVEEDVLSGSRVEFSDDGSWLPLNRTGPVREPGELYDFLIKMWYQIWETFNADTETRYCSGELCAVMVTLQGVINGLQGGVTEEEESCYYKAMEIVMRISRDPMSQYKVFTSNSLNNWLIYTISLYIAMRTRWEFSSTTELSNNTNTLNKGAMGRRKPKEDINYFKNLQECVKMDRVLREGEKEIYEVSGG